MTGAPVPIDTESVRGMDWTEGNQACLSAGFDWLNALFEGEGEAGAWAEMGRSARALGAPSALDELSRMFDLSDFERYVLLLVAASEMDSRIAGHCANINGHEDRAWASFAMALDLLPESHWSALTPARPLRQWQLLSIDPDARLVAARLRMDERVLHYLGGVNYLEPRLRPLLVPQSVEPSIAPSHDQLVAGLGRSLNGLDGPGLAPGLAPGLIVLDGDDRNGQRQVAARIAHGFGLITYRLNARLIPESAPEREQFAMLWMRESVLLGAALHIESQDDERASEISDLARRIDGLVCISSRSGVAGLGVEIGEGRGGVFYRRVNRPGPDEQHALWRDALGDEAAEYETVLRDLASDFRFSASEISQVAASHCAAPGPAGLLPQALWQTSREALAADTGARLSALAERLDCRVGWDDLVLPPGLATRLKDIILHVRHRLKVHHDWGFAGRGERGLGVAALFAGASGTGKTLAAEVVAAQLQMDLYRVDLASVVSKYIGETEKNLNRIFDAADSGGVILLFDEADALFGKRSDVKESHDRYANIEVAYLLQRLESYRGLSILTTNMEAAIDDAFMRRLRFVLHFPFPEIASRIRIWRQCLPASAPLADLDFEKLARLNMSGGHIRNITLAAAFLAAEAGKPIAMEHMASAAHAEAAKRGHVLSDVETRGWV